MQKKIKDEETAQIHVAGTFRQDKTDKYDRADMQKYVQRMLDEDDILYASVLTFQANSKKMVVQCKLHKAAINMSAIDDIANILESMDGNIDTWILTESAMHHPEVYK